MAPMTLVELPDWDDDMPQAEREKIAFEDVLVRLSEDYPQ